MRILIIGGSGMLGHKLLQEWKEKFEVWATLKGRAEDYGRFGIFDPSKTIDRTDVENFEAVERAVEKIQPEVIFNAVGIIKQLETSKNVIKTLNINSIFPHRLAELARKFNCRLINISTDCVFDQSRRVGERFRKCRLHGFSNDCAGWYNCRFD